MTALIWVAAGLTYGLIGLVLFVVGTRAAIRWHVRKYDGIRFQDDSVLFGFFAGLFWPLALVLVGVFYAFRTPGRAVRGVLKATISEYGG